MSVISVDKNLDTLTLTVVAHFDAPVEQVWQLWADPRQLERWWGPPSHPATVVEHDLTPGGAVSYFMTGPDGEKSGAWWRITSVDPPAFLEFLDGWADQDGTPLPDASTTTVQVRLTDHGGGTRMEVRSVFGSREQMDRILRLGAAEIFVQTIGQMDALLAG
jgi:uncharacterized protein YndB with AHSA1/START domain